jgi:hypothetical protein
MRQWLTLKKIMVILILVALILTSIFIFQNVKANASEVSVISYSSYVAPSNTVAALAPGDLITVGEVMNIGSDIVSDVTVQGTAFSASGQTLAVTGADAFVYDMLPGQKAPFYLDFSASSGLTQDLSWVPQVSSVTVQVTSVTDTNQRQYSDYDIQGRYNYTDNNGVYVAYGTLVNNGSQIVSYPWVVTTFYNATGGVISLNYTNFLTPTLSVNGAVRYFSTPLDNNTQLTNQIAAYSIQIDSLTVANSTSSPTATPTQSNTKPTTNFPILPIVIVVVLIAVAVAALLLFRKRKVAPLPPPPPAE